MSVTRYHFIAGMPTAGADRLAMVLAQNPRFVARSCTPAERLFREMLDNFGTATSVMHGLDPECRATLLRSTLDAVHHKRPLDSVVFDNDPGWMTHMEELAHLFPLSRFIFMVRDPAAVAAEIAKDNRCAQPPATLMTEDGLIGAPLAHLHRALNGPEAERVLLIDHARFTSDPIRVLDVLYRFLREPAFEHDVRGLDVMGDDLPMALRGQRRLVAVGNPARKRHYIASQIPVWRRTPRTEATLLLAETG